MRHTITEGTHGYCEKKAHIVCKQHFSISLNCCLMVVMVLLNCAICFSILLIRISKFLQCKLLTHLRAHPLRSNCYCTWLLWETITTWLICSMDWQKLIFLLLAFQIFDICYWQCKLSKRSTRCCWVSAGIAGSKYSTVILPVCQQNNSNSYLAGALGPTYLEGITQGWWCGVCVGGDDGKWGGAYPILYQSMPA